MRSGKQSPLGLGFLFANAPEKAICHFLAGANTWGLGLWTAGSQVQIGSQIAVPSSTD